MWPFCSRAILVLWPEDRRQPRRVLRMLFHVSAALDLSVQSKSVALNPRPGGYERPLLVVPWAPCDTNPNVGSRGLARTVGLYPHPSSLITRASVSAELGLQMGLGAPTQRKLGSSQNPELKVPFSHCACCCHSGGPWARSVGP